MDSETSSGTTMGAATDSQIYVTFTNADVATANKYSFQREKLFMVYRAASRYPNLATHTVVCIRAADPDTDYYFEDEFADRAIVSTVQWTKEGCEMLRCNSHYPPGTTCSINDPTILFSSGNSTLSACEPACFLKQTTDLCVSKDTDETATRSIAPHKIEQSSVDVPFLAWNAKKEICFFSVHDNYIYFTDPYMRSEKHYVDRLDNIRTGADVYLKYDENNDAEYAARHNRYYCEEFLRDYNEKTQSCEETTNDAVLSYTFIGTALPRMIRNQTSSNVHDSNASVTLEYLQKGGDDNPAILRSRVPGLKANVDHVRSFLRTKRAWRENIRHDWRIPLPSVRLSQLGITRENRYAVFWHNWEGLIANFVLLTSLGDPFAETIAKKRPAFESRNESSVDEKSRKRRHVAAAIGDIRDSTSPAKPLKVKNDEGDERQNSENTEELSQFAKWLYNFCNDAPDVVAMLLSKESLKEITKITALGIAETTLVEQLKVLLRKKVPNIIKKVTVYASRQAEEIISRRMVASVTKTIATKMLTQFAIKQTGKIALALAKTSSGALTFVGIAELFTTILDLVVTFGYDPDGFNKEFGNEVFDMMLRGAMELRERAGSRSGEITPYDIFFQFLQLSEDIEETEKSTSQFNRQSDIDSAGRYWFLSPVEKNYEEGDTRFLNSHDTFMIWSTSDYLAHRQTNSAGQALNWSNDDSFTPDDLAEIHKEVRRLYDSEELIDEILVAKNAMLEERENGKSVAKMKYIGHASILSTIAMALTNFLTNFKFPSWIILIMLVLGMVFYSMAFVKAFRWDVV